MCPIQTFLFGFYHILTFMLYFHHITFRQTRFKIGRHLIFHSHAFYAKIVFLPMVYLALQSASADQLHCSQL